MDVKQSNDLLLLVVIIAQVIAECGDEGVPGGTLYAALMCHGATWDKFQQVMQAMLKLGLVRKELGDHLYFITEKGQKLAAATTRAAQAAALAG